MAFSLQCSQGTVGQGLQARDMYRIRACSAEVSPSFHRGKGSMVLPAHAVFPWARVVCPVSRACSGGVSGELPPPPQHWIPALIVRAQVLGLRQEHAELAEIAEGLLHLQMSVLGTARKLTFHVAAPGITRSLA